jgi:hypothetical protein
MPIVNDKDLLLIMLDSYSMAKDYMKLKPRENSVWRMVMKLMCLLNKLEDVIYESIFLFIAFYYTISHTFKESIVFHLK